MIATEQDLAALAIALIGRARLPARERRLVPRRKKFSAREVAAIRSSIRSGNDPLGDFFATIRSAEVRREQGATYTPQVIVDAMVAWAANEVTPPVRVVDAGAGSGRFVSAAAKAFPKAKLIAVEIDPLAALLVRANAAALGFAKRLTVKGIDYRALDLPRIDGPTLFIGNPPYVRHHDISARWKTWFSDAAHKLGFKASALAGLHVHFFLRTRQIAQPGDYGAFITAAEWMDVNYGSVVRRMLADGLGGTALHVIDPKAVPFVGTLSTGAITCFRVGHRPDQLTVRNVASLDDLSPLSAGEGVDWATIEGSKRWSTLLRTTPRAPYGEIELGELFRVHRGQVTGCNAVWIAGDDAAHLPARYLFPAITKARDLLSAGEYLRSDKHLRRVVDLPVDLDQLNAADRAVVDDFLEWAKLAKAHKSFIATHRRAWWSVGLKEPAPILCTYMARRAPAFVRNYAGVRHLNISHGLYPVQPMSDATLDAIAKHLRETVSMTSGRVYAGGLVKFEPGEVSRLHIPDPSTLTARV
ncbi:Eco57I restriction-modification methylase domain-containing protein [Bradyrhizobium lablabi]|uniref:Eco57I restriction-modification methylase domain-containing protein n=1 Tax=Bradyrhizobium lablabi TaxID=722472 RepID=UPI0020124CC6|nr:class I SAM-dependent methyltransferase [Bradyrhizobium lablabi]